MLAPPPIHPVPQTLHTAAFRGGWKSYLTPALLVLVGLSGMGILFYSTTWGPAVGGDATVYIESARNLIAGRGLGWYGPQGNFHLLPLSPPLYPLVLAGFGWMGFDLVASARWLNVALYGATILLSGLSFYHFTRSKWLPVLLSILMLASPIVLEVHIWAMTEPLFTFIGLLSLVLLLIAFQGSRSRLWIFSAVLAGLALLARYAGVAFVGTGALACLLLAPVSRKMRGRMAILYGGIGILPVAMWGIYEVTATRAVGSRAIQPFSILWAHFVDMRQPLLETIISWVPFSAVLSSRINPPFSGILWAAFSLLGAGTLAYIFWMLIRQHGQQWLEIPGARHLALFIIFLGTYAAVIVLSYLFIFPPPHLSSRILSPLHWGGIFLLFSVVFLLNSLGLRWIKAAVGCILLVVLMTYGQRSQLAVMNYHRGGLGYTGAYWQNSDVITAARRIPTTTPLVTNDLSAVLFLLDRPAYIVQEIYRQVPVETFTKYGDEPGDEAQRVFRTQHAALLLFHSISDDLSVLYGEQTEERIKHLTDGLYLDYQGRDGCIYYYAPPGP